MTPLRMTKKVDIICHLRTPPSSNDLNGNNNNDDDDEDDVKGRYECNRCGEDFHTKYRLRRHVLGVHEALRPHSCPHCNIKFKDKGSATRHLKNVHQKQA